MWLDSRIQDGEFRQHRDGAAPCADPPLSTSIRGVRGVDPGSLSRHTRPVKKSSNSDGTVAGE